MNIEAHLSQQVEQKKIIFPFGQGELCMIREHYSFLSYICQKKSFERKSFLMV